MTTTRLLTIPFCTDETELAIANAERVDQRQHISIPLHTTEAFDGFEHAGRHPPRHHLTTPPALAAPLHMPCPADETLGGVGRRERAAEPRRGPVK